MISLQGNNPTTFQRYDEPSLPSVISQFTLKGIKVSLVFTHFFKDIINRHDISLAPQPHNLPRTEWTQSL